MYGSRVRLMPALILILIILLITAVIITDFKIKNSMLELAKAEAQVTGAASLSRIVNDKVVSEIKYEDIVSIHKDEQGKIVLVQPNTIMLNRIMSSTVMAVADSLGQMEDNIIEIPLGQLSGFDLLAAYGPKVKVKVIPAGQVHVEVLNKFEQAGINQTRHLIYFEVKDNLKVAVPFMKEECEVVAVIPLVETIIVGEVPETYVSYYGGSEMLYPLIKGTDTDN